MKVLDLYLNTRKGENRVGQMVGLTPEKWQRQENECQE